MEVIFASTLSPAAKRSGLCSPLSLDRSDLLINDVIPELKVTSIPLSFISDTVQVTVSPF